jgi:hypothetical protein
MLELLQQQAEKEIQINKFKKNRHMISLYIALFYM